MRNIIIVLGLVAGVGSLAFAACSNEKNGKLSGAVGLGGVDGGVDDVAKEAPPDSIVAFDAFAPDTMPVAADVADANDGADTRCLRSHSSCTPLPLDCEIWPTYSELISATCGAGWREQADYSACGLLLIREPSAYGGTTYVFDSHTTTLRSVSITEDTSDCRLWGTGFATPISPFSTAIPDGCAPSRCELICYGTDWGWWVSRKCPVPVADAGAEGGSPMTDAWVAVDAY